MYLDQGNALPLRNLRKLQELQRNTVDDGDDDDDDDDDDGGGDDWWSPLLLNMLFLPRVLFH